MIGVQKKRRLVKASTLAPRSLLPNPSAHHYQSHNSGGIGLQVTVLEGKLIKIGRYVVVYTFLGQLL